MPVARKVIADPHYAGGHRTTTDRAPGVGLSHGLLGQSARGVPRRRAEQRSLAVLTDAGAVDVGAQWPQPARDDTAWRALCRLSHAGEAASLRPSGGDIPPSFSAPRRCGQRI